MPEKMKSLARDFLAENGGRLLTFAVGAVLGFILLRVLKGALTRLLRSTRLRGAAGNFLAAVIKVALTALYGIVLLSLLGVDTASLVALFGAVTLALSLAVQGVVANLASGIMLVATKPFEEGDFVDIGGDSGTVEHILITCTKLSTPDNRVVTIPNSSVTAATITNYSTKGTRRLDLTFSAAYGTDVALVKEVILAVIARHGEVFADPAPTVRLAEHGKSSLDFAVRVWLCGSDYWEVSFDLKEEIYQAFHEKGIEIPFPQLDVHVVQ